MLRTIFTFLCTGLLIVLEAHADSTLRCGDRRYLIENGFFGKTVMQMTGTSKTPFCISDDPTVLTKTLSFNDKEVWCVTSHHLSPNSRPLAKQLWVLNTLSKKLYLYDYMFADDTWVLQQERIETCDVVP